MKTTIVITSLLILIFSFSIYSCSSSDTEYSAKPPKENIFQQPEEPCDGNIEL